MNGAPRIYGEETADWLLRDLTKIIREGFLRIKAGRPTEVRQQLEDTREALKRIKERKKLGFGKKPTQQQVAEELKVAVRTLRDWPRACNLTWDEWLIASKWENVHKGDIPHDWLTACRKLGNDMEGN
jgi:DNA-directed RNA polymerase specialized sigma subunit